MRKYIFLLLSLICLLAFVLRFYKVAQDPPALNWDEVSIGYNAYSILKTGRDEWGQFLPLHFKSYGEYKLPAQIYASIPAIALLGLNDFSVRITPVIYGTITILLLFFLTRSIFNNQYIALISAFLLAISPWHIQLTRASFESSFSVFWVILGIWLLIKGFSKPVWLLVSAIPFAVSVYTYNSARVFTPLFLIAVFLIYYKSFFINKRFLFLAIILFVFLMLPIVPFVLNGEGSARYKLVSITDDPGLVLRVNENRGKSKLIEPLPRLIHNKITYTALAFGQHYLAHFTPDFLFISGAPHKQHHVQMMGELYLFQAPFLFFGLYKLFKGKNRFRWLLLSWILLAFIPVSLTNDSIPHALRTLIAAPFYQIVTALGIFYFFFNIKRKKIFWQISIGFLVITILVSIGIYLNNFYNIYPKLYSRDWQYGNKQAVDFIKQNYSSYDMIVFTRYYGEPHMFTLFYLNYDPGKFQNNPNLVRFETYDWIRVLSFDKFYFPDLGDQGTKFIDIINKNPDKKILFIGKSNDFPTNVPRLKKITFLNLDPAFDIVEHK